jgi:hypothetical protein
MVIKKNNATAAKLLFIFRKSLIYFSIEKLKMVEEVPTHLFQSVHAFFSGYVLISL